MVTEYLGIKIDTTRDEFFTEQAKKLLLGYYSHPSDKTIQHSFARAAVCYNGGDLALSQRIYDYVSRGWFMFASPVLSNAVLPNEKPKAMPISCFLTYLDDTLESIIDHSTELRWLSVKGGGVGGHWSKIRAVSKKAPGPIPFLKTVDSDMVAFKQGSTRKGSYAAYMDISHPDIEEFIEIRVPSGDINRKCLNLHNAVNISDDFMEKVRANSTWDLLDPHTGEIKKTLKARYLWELILKTRMRTGEPYCNFIDTANAALPPTQKKLGLLLNGSNLCNEIHQPTNNERTAVCCLSSLNIELRDQWKDTNIVGDLIEFLDNVLQYFIDNAPEDLSKAVYSATQERSIGLGAMGYHSYLQSKMIPFDSTDAKIINEEIFKDIQEKAIARSLLLGNLKGVPNDMAGTGRRNAHVIAIAPNANSSIIVNTSPSIEPWSANAFSARTRVGTHFKKNKYLEQYLISIDKNTDDVWGSITVNEGSVQHLSFIPIEVKNVFKTAMEIDQMAIVEQGGDRQQYICQGQSLNVFMPPGVEKTYLNEVHFRAWEVKCKGLYYLRTRSSSKAEIASEKVERIALSEIVQGEIAGNEECVACEG